MIHVLKSGLTAVSISRSNFTGKPSCCYFRGNCRTLKSRVLLKRNLRLCCAAANEDNDQINSGEEPPESLFMKELRRRGIPPTSLLDDSERVNYGLDDEIKLDDDNRASSRRNAVSTEIGNTISEQRERSMALNSEGLEGLVPRAKSLLTLGGTFFLAFWPLILITVAFFSALYFYFGPSFVHDASKMSVSTPQYVDPYALLEDERISQIVPPVEVK